MTDEVKHNCYYCKLELTTVREKEMEAHIVCKELVKNYEYNVDLETLNRILPMIDDDYKRKLTHMQRLRDQIFKHGKEEISLRHNVGGLEREKKRLQARVNQLKNNQKWNEVFRFGITTIDLSFHQLTKKRHKKTKFKRICQSCNYEILPGEFVNSTKFANVWKYIHLKCFNKYLKDNQLNLVILNEDETIDRLFNDREKINEAIRLLDIRKETYEKDNEVISKRNKELLNITANLSKEKSKTRRQIHAMRELMRNMSIDYICDQLTVITDVLEQSDDPGLALEYVYNIYEELDNMKKEFKKTETKTDIAKIVKEWRDYMRIRPKSKKLFKILKTGK